MIRHGRAEAGWDTSMDPGLDELGRQQADEVAAALGDLSPVPIVSSPLLRCQQTAAPLGALWGASVAIEPAVAEIPSPQGVPMGERVHWLRQAMVGTWADLGEPYQSYRDAVAAWMIGRREDTVVFSHFVAINAVIGAALGDDRLVIHSLDNCSITTFAVDDGQLRLLEAGREADTLIR